MLAKISEKLDNKTFNLNTGEEKTLELLREQFEAFRFVAFNFSEALNLMSSSRCVLPPRLRRTISSLDLVLTSVSCRVRDAMVQLGEAARQDGSLTVAHREEEIKSALGVCIVVSVRMGIQ